MKPPVRLFTKDRPCTKLDIWRCFYHPKAGFVRVQVDTVHAEIGLNAPRGMVAQARLARVESKGVEVYGLTPEGEQWLILGIMAYVKNHPLEASSVGHIPIVGARNRARRAEANPVPVTPSGRIRRVR